MMSTWIHTYIPHTSYLTYIQATFHTHIHTYIPYLRPECMASNAWYCKYFAYIWRGTTGRVYVHCLYYVQLSMCIRKREMGGLLELEYTKYVRMWEKKMHGARGLYGSTNVNVNVSWSSTSTIATLL